MKLESILWLVPIVMALVALGRMGPGFYEAIRFVVPICVGMICVIHWRAKDGQPDVWLFALLAVIIIFNPLVPLHLGRGLWKLVDVGTAATLGAHFFAHGPGYRAR